MIIYIRIFIISFILIGINNLIQAQNNRFNNEWIDYSKKYAKISISSEGIYKLTQSDLIQAGISASDLSNINNADIQIFYQGMEQPIFTSNNGIGFSTNDFILFYANKNDGSLDSLMYRSPSEQPHTLKSLYTDTAMYYICWGGNANGKRFKDYKKTDYSNYTELNNFIHTDYYIYPNQWYPAPTDVLYLEYSDFTLGEGWFSGLLKKQTAKFQNFFSISPKLLDYDNTSAFLPKFTIDVYGYSNDHHQSRLEFKIGSTFKKYKDTTFERLTRLKLSGELPKDSFPIDSLIPLRLSNPIHPAVAIDNQYISHVSFTYPRKFNMRYGKTLSIIYNNSQDHFVKLFNYTDNEAYLFDIDEGYMIGTTLSNSIIQTVIPGSNLSRRIYICGSSSYKKVDEIKSIPMNPIDLTKGYNYLMVSHKKLYKSANAFKDYRAKDTAIKPLLVYMDELYDQFGYGYHSPLAIRHFVDYMLTKNNVQPEHLLLLGKGLLYYFMWTLDQGKQIYLNLDLVPTWGYPGSDILITSGLNGSKWGPGISTGRISAFDDQQLYNYLDKLKIYESSQNNTDEIWKKRILHLGGGRTQTEADNFKNVLNDLKKIAEGDSLGGNVTSLFKFEPQPSTPAFSHPSQALLYNGLGFTYYFGHGATDILEVDLGDTSTLKNSGKYPIMFFAGCQLGNCFTPYGSKAEQWLFARNRGAIGWMANTAYGFATDLQDIATQVYTHGFNTDYGKPFGTITKNSIEGYVGNRLDEFAFMHARQVIWQGDPLLKYFSPDAPDYYLPVNDTKLPFSLSMYPEGMTAISDSFAIKIDAYNKGKSTGDSVILRVKRTLPNGQQITYPDSLVLPPKWNQTYYFWIKSKDINTQGPNIFEVSININRKVPEYQKKYGNNTATFKYNIPATGANIVFPYNYAIVSENPIKLQAQQSNVNFGNSTFIFQLDTNYQFKSNWPEKRVSSNQIANVFFSLLPKDSTAYYWRVRLDKASGVDTSWQTGSFTYIKNVQSGWGQIQTPQLYRSELYRLFVDSIDNYYSFTSRTGKTVSMVSAGSGYAGAQFARVFRIDNGGAVDGNLGFGWAVLTFNPIDETIFNYPDKIYNVNKKGVFRFDTRKAAQRDAFIKHIDTIPDGYKVFIMKGDSTGNLLDPAFFPLKQTFVNKLGSSQLIDKAQIQENWPFLMKATKGAAKGTAREQTADNSGGSPLPPSKQIITEYDQIGPKYTDGYMTSEMIGPALKWQTFYKKTSGIDHSADTSFYDLLFYDVNGNEMQFASNQVDDTFDISSVDAKTYPTMKVRFYFDDDSLRTPEQLKYWIATYKGVPEGAAITNPLLPFVYVPKDTVSEGDSIQVGLAFRNISRYDFDSILVTGNWTDDQGNTTDLFTERLKPLLVNDTVFISKKYGTKGKLGNNIITINFNPNFDQAEQYLYNNQMTFKFNVNTDIEPPILDVTFDGQHIMNNELVCPNPVILISVKDENKHFPIKDPNSIKAWITYPGQPEIELDLNNSPLTFTPSDGKNSKAMLTYTPTNLSDGVYQLRAQAFDATGNAAGNTDYKINFKVNTKPSISHIYPYPNPFSTKCHFAFTLTGTKVPDQIHIQIMTISGIIVKEIYKEDLGNIRIGNNITEYTWDGSDQFGDKLANGVYLYKVQAQIDGKAIEMVDTNNDVYFKNGLGKIIILR